MKYQKWNIAPGNAEAVTRLMEAGYPYLVSGVLASRGIVTEEAAAEFLAQETNLDYSPFLMADMDKAVVRINDALANGEKIAVFGDYDVDGITATCILTDYLQNRGGDVIHYIPRRIEDGYGLSRDAITGLRQQGARLLISVDCGITGVEEVAYAKSIGMDAVITDHHECKDALPDACAVVDPHRPDCGYPFKQLAGCGVALKLVLALGGESREEAIFSRYCTLAAIGTIADVMLMSGENRTIVQRGLAALEHTDFIGLHALLQETGLAGRPVNSVQVGFVLSPRINAAGRMGAADMAADLLLCQDPERSAEMARELCALNRERQLVEQSIYAEAEELIAQTPERLRGALVLANDKWHQGVVGIVASRLSEKYSRPSFMIRLNGETGKGSCRSWGGFNLYAALESCSDLLVGFGGHELAAGFTIEAKNVDAFRERMNRYVSDYRGGEKPVTCLDVDMDIQRTAFLTLPELEALDSLEPYGSGNPRPLFCLCGATIATMQSVGQNRHVKLRLTKGTASCDAIFFSATPESCGCQEGDRVDAAFYLQINEFRGTRSVQMQMVDIRPSLLASGKEEEALAILDACIRGEELDAHDALRLLPAREQCVQVWHGLEKLLSAGSVTTAYLPLVRQLGAALGKNEPFLRAAFCLELFRERALISLQRNGDMATLRLSTGEKKVVLEASPYWQRLQSACRGKGEPET